VPNCRDRAELSFLLRFIVYVLANALKRLRVLQHLPMDERLELASLVVSDLKHVLNLLAYLFTILNGIAASASE
jgi:hypothetical protein